MWMIFDNLRGFLTSRSPLVLFMLCLGLFAILLLTLGYLVKVKELQNPDKKDWNNFLDGFKKIQFCVITNVSDAGETQEESLGEKNFKEVISSVHDKIKGDNHEVTTAPQTSHHPDDIQTVSVPMWVEVKPTKEFVNIPHNVTHLSASLAGNQLGIQGSGASTPFTMSLTLPFEWNTTVCKSDKDCLIVRIHTCVHLQAPASFFPKYRRPNSEMCRSMNDTAGTETRFRVTSKKKSGDQSSLSLCDKKTAVSLTHNNDPTLRIMLTLQDRSAINLHLLHTSYFLFVMVVTLLCYGLIRGRPPLKVKQYSELTTSA